eukprot:TRINITY_DN1573_c0_g1_i5.p1 TRINITY_DN1573_c0_g1~~TRINITY_DN1573_c0_g1_i5.p1  ORF type:complete len:455 (-),score=82.49 TRINITY_DN1573_c0_g1_i5:70-1248(-)
MRYLIALTLFSFAAATEWKSIDNVYSSLFDYGVVSNGSGFFHFALCSGGSFHYLYYQRLNVTSGKFYRHGFYVPGNCRSAQIGVQGKRIFLLYQVVQTCPVGAFSCSYIYLVESLNNGYTWKNPIRLEQNNTNISYSYNPLLVHDPSGKLWVAYKHFTRESPTLIKVASKEPNATQFANYTTLAVTNQSTIIPGGLAFARTRNGSSSMLHAVWEVRDEGMNFLHGIYYSRSGDGVGWSQPAVVGETNLCDHTSPLALASNESDLHLVFTRTDGAKRGVWVAYTRDQGNNWAGAKRVSAPANYLSTSAHICTAQRRKRLYILNQDQILEKAFNTFGYREIETEQMFWLGNPYDKDLKDCYTPHVVCDDKTVLLVCKVNIGKQNYRLIYRSHRL